MKTVLLLIPSFSLLFTGCSAKDTPAPEADGECSEEEFEAVSAYLLDPLSAEGSTWTCTQCHDSSINPLMWHQETACQTMACFQENSLLDFDTISDSEILFFIHQAEAFGAISTDLSLVRQGELLDRMFEESRAYSRWINYGSTCFTEACSAEAQQYEGSCAFQIDWGSCDPDDGLRTFEDTVFESLMDPCSDCHSADGDHTEAHPSAPHFLETDIAAGPTVTLTRMLERFLISTETPEASKILTRPLVQGETVETPLGSVTGVWHGGGDLWTGEDHAFVELVGWIEDYTECLTP